MNKAVRRRFVAFGVSVAMMVAAVSGFAEQPFGAAAELRHQAFLRGGSAIVEALTPPKPAGVVLPADALPPQQPQPAPQTTEHKNHRVMLWIGLGITAGIAAYLIHKSVDSHGKIFGSN